MDIVRFKSGLGNQMFQYAFYQALRHRGRCVRANLGYYDKYPEKMSFSLNKVFPHVVLEYISNREFDAIDFSWKKIKMNKEALKEFLSDTRKRFFWVEEKDAGYLPEVFDTTNCTFIGYWQSEKYFHSLRDVLLEDFEFSYGEDKLRMLCQKFINGEKYVAVQIRRGDYLEHPELWGNLSESSYYWKAIDWIKKSVSNPIFVFFSDDIQWVKKKYNYENAIYIEAVMFDNYEPWYDMCLMSYCSHNIIANSTFGWWGAWLNRNENKIVVVPQKWFFDGKTGRDICPEDWKRVDVD